MLNNKREICLSISSKPGAFGETVHNAGYNYQKLNFFYKAVEVVDLENTVKAIKLLQIKGCSVSMPFKEEIIEYIDMLDEDAKKAGAVNTILNDNNVLKGFNTDIFGAFKALDILNINKNDNVFILGAGGVARAIIIALKKQNIFNIFITNRNIDKARNLSNLFNCTVVNWEKRNNFKSSILINTTPIGMKKNSVLTPININSLKNFEKVMDVVVSEKETSLIKAAKDINMPYVTGLYMTFFQAAKQYKIYTGFDAPIQHMVKAYNSRFNKKIELDLS
jgi:shikimate dehydrogenase